MRVKLHVPLLIQPGFYWNKHILTLIDGIYPNSPAERAGLQFGDRIVRVDKHVIVTRAEAAYLLELPPEAGKPWGVQVEIERQSKRFVVELANEFKEEDDFYPYKPRGYRPVYEVLGRWAFGVQLMDGFDLGPVRLLKEIVDKHSEARKVVIFTSPLVQNLYAQALQIIGNSPDYSNPGVECRVTIAPQRFWGGNIQIGDLHVVQDYVDHLRSLRQLGYQPDLAIIPSSFTSRWGFDIIGCSSNEIERRSGVPVELLPVRRVMV